MHHDSAVEALKANKLKLFAVLRKYRVVNPRLFGSLARGDFDVKSDIDILVSKTAPMDYATIADLRREASDALEWPVDLVFDTALKDDVRENIQSDLRPLL